MVKRTGKIAKIWGIASANSKARKERDRIRGVINPDHNSFAKIQFYAPDNNNKIPKLGDFVVYDDNNGSVENLRVLKQKKKARISI